MMTGGANNMINRVEQKTKILMKGGVKTENERSTRKWVTFAIDAKGGEKKNMMIGREEKPEERVRIMKGGA